MKKLLPILALALFTTSLEYSNAIAAPQASTKLTIYSKASPGSIPPEAYRPIPGQPSSFFGNSAAIPGYGVVKQQRSVTLKDKRSNVAFSDVAAYIDPTTVIFTSLTAPEQTHVIEQNYLFDLASQQKLLERYLGKEIVVEQAVGDKLETATGILMSTDNSLMLQETGGKILALNNYTNIRFPALPEGLITKPTLMWDIATDKPGEQQMEVSYQTSGMTWWADYNMVLTEKDHSQDGVLDVNAWVSIINQSGASYPDAQLKLVAGDVHRAEAPPVVQYGRAAPMALMAEADKVAGFAEKSFFEYHLYTLGRLTTLPDNSTKQIELFPVAHNIPVKKEFIFRSYQNDKVQVALTFENNKKNGLGLPLPAGRIRISKQDSADKSLEFIGEDTINHTPEGENVRVALGNAFDIVAERKVLDNRADNARNWREEDIEIILKNRKDSPVDVTIEEMLAQNGNWKILKQSHDFTKKDASFIRFPVTIAKKDKVTVTYTVRYEW